MSQKWRFIRFFSYSFLLIMLTLGAEAIDLDEQLEEFEDRDEGIEDLYDVETVIHEFDGNTKLVDYRFSNNNDTVLIFESETPRTLTLFDINAFSERELEEPPEKSFSLNNGYTAIQVDLTRDRGDESALLNVGDNYYLTTNSRTSALIGQPESQYGFVLGIIGGGSAVLLVGFWKIKKKQRRIDQNGIRTD